MDFWLLKKGQWNLAIPRTILERDFCCWTPPWWDQVVLGRGPCIFTRHLKLIKELWLELIWCSPYEWPACGLASVYETTVNTNRCAWVNSFDHLTSREAKSMINISDASSRPTCLWITLCGPAGGWAVNCKALIWCSINLSYFLWFLFVDWIREHWLYCFVINHLL